MREAIARNDLHRDRALRRRREVKKYFLAMFGFNSDAYRAIHKISFLNQVKDAKRRKNETPEDRILRGFWFFRSCRSRMSI